MSVSPDNAEGRAGRGASFLRKLRHMLNGPSKDAHPAGAHKMPPIAEVVARTGRKARDER